MWFDCIQHLIIRTAKVVAEDIVDSGVEYKDMNPRMARIYLATVRSKKSS